MQISGIMMDNILFCLEKNSKCTTMEVERIRQLHDDTRRVKCCILLLLLLARIARTTHVDVVYCYQPNSMVCRLVCHTSEPCKNGWTDRDAVWVEDSGGPRKPCIRWGSRLRGKEHPIVKYRDTLQSSVQKGQNQSRCCFGCGLEWAKEIMCLVGSRSPTGRGNFGERVAHCKI